jgi:hypothetical protein
MNSLILNKPEHLTISSNLIYFLRLWLKIEDKLNFSH